MKKTEKIFKIFPFGYKQPSLRRKFYKTAVQCSKNLTAMQGKGKIVKDDWRYFALMRSFCGCAAVLHRATFDINGFRAAPDAARILARCAHENTEGSLPDSRIKSGISAEDEFSFGACGAIFIFLSASDFYLYNKRIMP